MTDIHIPVHVPLRTDFIFNPLFEEGFYIKDIINGIKYYGYYGDDYEIYEIFRYANCLFHQPIR